MILTIFFMSLDLFYRTKYAKIKTNNPYTILGEPKEISSSIKLVYHPSFTTDEYDFVRCVWTSLQADEECYNIVKTIKNEKSW
jgi:hypothetical protein